MGWMMNGFGLFCRWDAFFVRVSEDGGGECWGSG